METSRGERIAKQRQDWEKPIKTMLEHIAEKRHVTEPHITSPIERASDEVFIYNRVRAYLEEVDYSDTYLGILLSKQFLTLPCYDDISLFDTYAILQDHELSNTDKPCSASSSIFFSLIHRATELLDTTLLCVINNVLSLAKIEKLDEE